MQTIYRQIRCAKNKPPGLILFASTLFFIASDLFGQIQISGPSHPLISYGMTRMDTSIDTIFTYSNSFCEEEVVGCISGIILTTTSYKRSEDNLTDTVIMSGIRNQGFIFRYNEKNQLLYQDEMGPTYPSSFTREEYEYNEKGRQVKLVRKYIQTTTQSEIIHNEYLLNDYSNIRMTEKGYICDDIEYELDNQGRVICIQSFGDHIYTKYYTYTDSSYIEFSCRLPEGWHFKNIYDFYENGHTKRYKELHSSDGINWKILSTSEYEYIYSKEMGTPINNPPIDKTNIIVTANSGSILVLTENTATVQIYDLTGRAIKQQTVFPGETRITISAGGFYIVKVGNESFKVSVR